MQRLVIVLVILVAVSLVQARTRHLDRFERRFMAKRDARIILIDVIQTATAATRKMGPIDNFAVLHSVMKEAAWNLTSVCTIQESRNRTLQLEHYTVTRVCDKRNLTLPLFGM